MSTQLQRIINTIQSRDNYDKHIVLDGGKHTLMVKDIEGNLYTFKDTKWNRVSHAQAQAFAERYYHYNSFLDLLEEA
ncbi:MAG: hypothetical protein GQ570_08550 [Helicobacteraceae bacterium]|nr:hypothetical protein [Helicobacteraceae bacterium]